MLEAVMREDYTPAVNRLMVTGSAIELVLQGTTPAVSQLFVQCADIDELLQRPRVAIVGSRRVSPYGREVTHRFAHELAQAGVVIVSGLALGVDAVAHEAALEAGGLTLAVLPGGLGSVYPASHHNLARRIVAQGGALLSEYESHIRPHKYHFVERNRIVSGISDALLITEAAIDSGTMHTARFALEQGKDVLAVPGNITSPTSAGTNNLLQSGAGVATSTQDVLDALGVAAQPLKKQVEASSPAEQCILDLLEGNVRDGSVLLERSKLSVNEFNQTFTMLEITGKVRPLGANQWSLH